MRISWIEIPERINHELQQRAEEGNDVAAFRREWDLISSGKTEEASFLAEAEKFYRKLEATPSIVKNAVHEPSEWNAIVSCCRVSKNPIPVFPASFIEDRIAGGWLGRSAGCLLGKPIEKHPRSGIIELLSSNGTWPINNFITAQGIPETLLKKYPWNRHYGKESLKENIVCMPEDDDMNYPMLNLSTFAQYGEVFTPEHVLRTWLEMAPVLSTFTAERVAYLNRLNGIEPPQTASVLNPYREWIGAQIRADFWGWISPAMPARAAEFAWRDASISHLRNGMYGEIFFAAAIAAAFQYSDTKSVIEEALKYVPPRSRFAEAITFVLSLPIQNQPWDVTVNSLYTTFGSYHWVHTINNAALVTAALLSSNGEYERAICNVVMGGWDTDSNGATVGSIMGTMLGAKQLPSKWIGPLNNEIRTGLKGYDRFSITALASKTAACAKFTPKN